LGAGTVEFVASGDGDIFFLEVNARLQVEHCVTEMVTGVDLVEQQIRVAAGLPLSPEVLDVKRSGHSIEARVYAEDPAKKFAPQPGRIDKLVWPAGTADLRIETGVEQGSEVTPYYDPMIAKVVAHGEDRNAAIARLDAALSQTTLAMVGAVGPAATNLDFLRKVLAADAFVKGEYDTHFAEALAKQK
jgi:acetyl/propionyl-CoA carboxylase alpha subunit